MNRIQFFFRRAVSPALPALLFIACLTGCGGAPVTEKAVETAKTNTVASAPAASEAAVAAAKSAPLDSLTKSMQAALAAKSMRARLQSTSGGQEMVMEFEYAAPDRYHTKGAGMEMILIGNDTWTKLPGQERWMKMGAGMGKAIESFRNSKMIEELKKSTDMKFIGPDLLDGAPTLVYEYTAKDAMGLSGTSKSKTWVGALDNLPRKMEFTGDYGGTKSTGTMTWYDYNADVRIEPPAMK
ncbi:MAG: hypothetical protein ACKV2V_14195 [Blastocatellia bacterium]